MVRKTKVSPFHPIFVVLLVIVILLISQEPRSSSAYGYTIADFPPDFVFGAGSSAPQVEGAANEDGRTPSILDTNLFNPGEEIANLWEKGCDQYHKYKDDVKLMVDTGLPAYKMSISWSRLIPNGRGTVNLKAVEYYNNVINELVNNGIQPHVVVVHMDLPQALEDDYGGWINQQVVKDFTTYADVCFREFGDRVLYWTTFNEPNIIIRGGYDSGTFPPKRCSSPFGLCDRGNSTTEPYIAGHNTLLAHASAVRLYKNKYQEKQQGYIGLNVYTNWLTPKTDTKEDLLAVQTVNKFHFGWFLDPLVFGDYPDIMKKRAGSRIPSFTKYESQLVKHSFDFIAVNCYDHFVAKDNPGILSMSPRDFVADSGAEASFGKHHEEAVEHVLELFKQEYGNPPVYIHENGFKTYHNASLHDKSRVEFLNASIGSILNAVRNGSNVRGYFLWSFLDAVEFLNTDVSYGLYYVDFGDPDLRRYPKFSARWYSAFLRGRSLPIDEMTLEMSNLSDHPLHYS